jgi:hypothetical protein
MVMVQPLDSTTPWTSPEANHGLASRNNPDPGRRLPQSGSARPLAERNCRATPFPAQAADGPRRPTLPLPEGSVLHWKSHSVDSRPRLLTAAASRLRACRVSAAVNLRAWPHGVGGAVRRYDGLAFRAARWQERRQRTPRGERQISRKASAHGCGVKLARGGPGLVLLFWRAVPSLGVLF